MNYTELQQLAERTRAVREAGLTLLGASALLALFLFLPLTPQKADTQAAVLTEAPAPAAPDSFANVVLDAKAAIVYDLATGETLYAKNADSQLPLASLTKLLTVYAALSSLSPDTPITIPNEASTTDAPRAFAVGQTFRLSDLARLTLVASLNDGAISIAYATAIRENETEAATLASAISALDLAQTYAINGSGLDENVAISGGYGSAHDVAILAGGLVAQAASIAEATTLSSASATSLGGTHITVKNTDPIIGSIPHMLLSKTGYTELAGGNLVLVFDVGIGHPVAVVVLGSTRQERFVDGNALVSATLAHFAGIASL